MRKETRGRKPIDPGSRMVMSAASFRPADAELLRRLGGGSLSLGIRRMVDMCRDEAAAAAMVLDAAEVDAMSSGEKSGG